MKRLKSHKERFSGVPILMYHGVSKEDERAKKVRSTSPEYSISVEKFKDQMLRVVAKGIETCWLDELVQQGEVPAVRRLVITFDDALGNNYDLAYPILRSCGFRGTVFAISQFVGESGYASWAQLREMYEGGISVESHTATHRPLTELGDDDIWDELIRSKHCIEDHVGGKVNYVSVPHGMINARVVEIAGLLGYRGICTSDPGLTRRFQNPAVMKRINISGRCPMDRFEDIIEGKKRALLPIMGVKKVKNLIRSVIGYDQYRWAYTFWHKIGG